MARRAGRITLALPRASDLAALAVALFGATAAAAEPPGRVVSINLCTDQLTMLLAAPGQLISVSHIAADPLASVMADRAGQYHLNHGQAEEIHAMAPDLVVTGPYTARYTVDLLRRLGIEVRELPVAQRLADIPDNIARMGDWLGREAQADRLITDFEDGLAALAPDAQAGADARPTAVLHYANNYTAGTGTLAHEILTHAGFANLAERAGVSSGGTLPMEQLVMLMPDAVISGQRYPGQTRAEAVLDHPAIAALRDTHSSAAVSDAEWVCGTPAVLSAIARVRALHGAGG
ncbi:MAG: ABC-type cobalamin uptake system ATPase component BtuD [Rhodobacteraceae bacterium HLUCCA12]|nr:MAG: ABC-type cobalamin uptake system ATPase component BtuD [Rhodobacteraceae bacterium HLUCCA12]